VFNSSRDKNRILTVEEIMGEIHCCKGPGSKISLKKYGFMKKLPLVLISQFDPTQKPKD